MMMGGVDAVEDDDGRPLLAIVGAGIGGLALANAAQRWGARVAVFERDADFDVRSQGYGLTMQQGGSALRALGLYGLREGDLGASGCITAALHVSFASDGRILGRYGHKTRQQSSGGAGDPDAEENAQVTQRKKSKRRNFLVPRQRLRQELLDSLPASTVRWGCNFESYSQLGPESDGRGVLLRFTAGRHVPGGAAPTPHASVRASVLVGADGIFSRVARQRLSAESVALEYSGVLVVLGIARLDKEDLSSHELLATCDTVTETADGTSRLYTMPYSKSHHMWQLSTPMPLVQAQTLHKAGPEALLREARRLCEGWHDPLPALLKATAAADVTGYPVLDRTPLPSSAMRPVRADHQEDRTVTILGDALHPMAPFKGQGANTALQDGVRLANELEHSAFGDATRAAIAASATVPPVVPPADVQMPLIRSTEDALSSFEIACLDYSAVKVETSRIATRKLHAVSSHAFMKARQDASTFTDDSHAWRGTKHCSEQQTSRAGANKRGKRQANQVQLDFEALRESEDVISRALAVGKLVHVLSRNKTSEYLCKVTSAPLDGGSPDTWGVKAVRPDTGVVSHTAVQKWVHISQIRTRQTTSPSFS